MELVDCRHSSQPAVLWLPKRCNAATRRRQRALETCGTGSLEVPVCYNWANQASFSSAAPQIRDAAPSSLYGKEPRASGDRPSDTRGRRRPLSDATAAATAAGSSRATLPPPLPHSGPKAGSGGGGGRRPTPGRDAGGQPRLGGRAPPHRLSLTAPRGAPETGRLGAAALPTPSRAALPHPGPCRLCSAADPPEYPTATAPRH